MQNTRLNSLVDRTTDRLGSWLQNPWRRVSVLIISLLFGNYVGPALSLVAGQQGQVDIIVAALVVALTELISLFAYRRRPEGTRSLLLDSLNAFKVGLTYSLIVDAFKLGS
ncbi:DUF565 domain-containing protein [Leptolyngbya sp. FACHB-321]|uniref:DUF565 domain-containing protein n=1 Tax=Leptolyngbya sp. FACHB-321 TaxID=2692807 RepID=UPI0016862825|nr:DUF565 domain-containing protein [Leptolyngbya sp. FACHB-321]MBD2034176.1 DUF565 domain-containing protein [Leptolyngbya sp. FACHB-321]